MAELHDLTAREQLRLLRDRRLSPLELVDHYLARIALLDQTAQSLGAFITVTAEAARERARRLADAGPDDSPLWGLPTADKDLTARAGVRTTYGSKAFEHYVPERSDALAIALDAAGTISLGKTNTPEFGLPGYTESDVAPPARNPWRTELGAGGSSGGAAVAVSAGMLPVAPGSDGGGSIRMPAAATGLVGLKPSRGRVPSGTGLTMLGGLGVHGPIARTTGDAALLFEAMLAGPYRFATRAPADQGWLAAVDRPEGRFRIAVLQGTPWDGWRDDFPIVEHQEATDAVGSAVRELEALGHDVGILRLSGHEQYAAAFHTIWQAGASTLPVGEDQLSSLQPLTRWLRERGRSLGAPRLAEALAALTEFEQHLIELIEPWDAVLTPTLACTPRPIGWYDPDDGERNFAQQVQVMPYTSMLNAAGLPAISVPVHVTAEGLPMGAQLFAGPGQEKILFKLASQLEAAIGWQHRHPPAWSAER
ncbi:amidase [Ruicaihuangia caeni]|uniref:Amidase n=1 Tax=Ruicaihuangia caeni TaxID=3042517 RepID=A0AAW6T7R1_9MICO|nr:amidase [Klugiella sp. YN-L-19]MDI2097440.1 amidase [Klugiella sp. YN-L-19]